MAKVTEKMSKRDIYSSEEAVGMPARLLYCKDSKQVLLMEIGREFVDILVTFMSLPFPSLFHLFDENKYDLWNLDCMKKLLISLEKLKGSTFPTPWPIAKLEHSSSNISLLVENNTANCVYRCASLTCNLESVAMSPHSFCPSCKGAMTTPVTLLSGKDSLYCCGSCGNGSSMSKHWSVGCPKCGLSMNKTLTVVSNPDRFIRVIPAEYLPKHAHRFLIADGLIVMPDSAIDGIMLLCKKQKSGEIGYLEINVTPDQVIKFLGMSLYRECILNDVFGHLIGPPE